MWQERLDSLDASVHMNIRAEEHVPAGAENAWMTWTALNQLRTMVEGQYTKMGLFQRLREL